MRIAFSFVTGFAWDGATWEEGVGGAEAAVATMAAALVRRGHEVTVFTGTRQRCRWRGVEFRPGLELPGPAEAWDVLLEVTRALAVRAEVRVIVSLEDDVSWAGDYRAPGGVAEIWALSHHHARILVERLGAPAHLVRVMPPGIETAPYRAPLPKVRRRMIYCSVPVCGAAFLAPVYRRVRAAVPDATLVVTGDMRLWGHGEPGLSELRELASLPGARVLGRVPRRELVRLQLTSHLHLYPCVCHELLCLAAAECQAAGAPTVAPAAGALAETVLPGETGLVLPVDPADGAGQAALAEAAAALLRDERRLERMAARARERALVLFDADLRAEAWEARLRELGAPG